jgi:hypothetical protein
VMAAALALGALGIGAVLFVATRAPQPKDAPAAASAIKTATAATANPSASSAGAAAASSPAGGWVAVPPPAHVERLEPVSNTPSVPVSALAPLRPPPRTAPATAPGPAAAPASPAPGKPSCNPPYEFDENGNKHWKRECL